MKGSKIPLSSSGFSSGSVHLIERSRRTIRRSSLACIYDVMNDFYLRLLCRCRRQSYVTSTKNAAPVKKKKKKKRKNQTKWIEGAQNVKRGGEKLISGNARAFHRGCQGEVFEFDRLQKYFDLRSMRIESQKRGSRRTERFLNEMALPSPFPHGAAIV